MKPHHTSLGIAAASLLSLLLLPVSALNAADITVINNDSGHVIHGEVSIARWNV
ncbi:MAG: hypothetical protein V4819_00445 [Verrucomicrobiota bacterium]